MMFKFCEYLLCIIGPFVIARKENYLQLNMDKKGHPLLPWLMCPTSKWAFITLFSNQLYCFIDDYLMVEMLWRLLLEF
jgi:hypothetical protein